MNDLFSFLMFGVPGLGGDVHFDYYVDATLGNDVTGDGSRETPWASIHKALTTINIAGGVSIGVKAGTYAENSGSNYLNVDRDFLAKVTVQGYGGTVTLTNNGATDYCVRINGASNVEFNNLVITSSGAITNGVVAFSDAATADITFANCTIDGWGGNAAINLGANVSVAFSNIAFNACTVRPNASNAAAMRCLYITTVSTATLSIAIINCAMTGRGGAAGPTAATIDILKVNTGANVSVTLSGGTYTNTSSYAMRVHGGTVAISDAVFTSNASALVVGVDGLSTFVTTGTVTNCTVSSASSHGLVLGGSCDGVIADGITASSDGDYAVLIKECDNCTLQNSVVTGGSIAAVYFKGAVGCDVIGNTIEHSSARCIYVAAGDTGNKNQNNTLTGNQITALATADIFIWGDAVDDAGGSVCDSNTYDISGTSGNLGSVYGTANIATIAALRDAWNTYDVPTNDDNSTAVLA